MSNAIDKGALLARRAPETESGLPEDDVEIPGVGIVRVRGLNRLEVIGVRKATDNDPATVDGPRALVLERKMIALAMIDPPMTEAEVLQWQANAPAGELDHVADKISELSGMAQGAPKSDLSADGQRPRDRVRDVPSDRAVDDGVEPAAVDE